MIAITKPNNLTAKVQVQDLEQTTQGRGNEPNRILLVTIHHIIYLITMEVLHQVFVPHGEADKTKPPLSIDTCGNNGGDDLVNLGPVTGAEQVVDNGYSFTFSSVFKHESPQVLQVWEIIGIGDVYEVMDNRGIYKFVQLHARERIRLEAMMTGQSYQEVRGSPKESS
ncbi:hypothetical protein Tco_0804029 [Tanacetum coccineum]|uniref:Uncharacterized protein n=1 Tax=Tanacetum coccineum TaxID=301880 RepID=A0ABQ5A5Q8_9ASTR